MANPNVGFATLQIIPSMRGAKSAISNGITGPAREAGKDAGDQMGSEMGAGAASKLGDVLKAGALGIGVAAGAILAKGIGDAIAQEASTDKLAAQLGLSEEQSAEFGRIAGSIYAQAYGESFGQVTDALGQVQGQIGDFLNGGDLEQTTIDALNLASAFDLDVADAVQRAGILLRNGLADDAEEAFDLVIRAMQTMNPALRDELGDATSEYSRFFSDLGISGSEMLGLFAQADDMMELDKIGDAIKEFGIRATDMSTLTTTAFETMGMDAETMAGRLVAGGETARGAFEEIITGLYNIEDPVTRANTAIALFGTPLEDLGVNEIPAFLTRLGEMETGLGDVDGAADDLNTTLGDNTATTLETFKRGMQQKLVDFLGGTVIPAVEELTDAWKEDGFSGALDLLIDEKLPEFLDAFTTWLEEEGIPAFVEAGKRLGGEFAKAYIDGVESMLTSDAWLMEIGGAFGFLPFANEATVNPLDPTGEKKVASDAAIQKVIDVAGWVAGKPLLKSKSAGGSEWLPLSDQSVPAAQVQAQSTTGTGGVTQEINIFNPVAEPSSESILTAGRRTAALLG